MAIGYTKVGGTLYEIGPSIEEWQSLGEVTITDSGSSSSTRAVYTITPNISDTHLYSRVRMKLVCVSAGTFTSTTSGTAAVWWVWVDNRSGSTVTTANYPLSMLALRVSKSSSSTTFDFSSFSDTESPWIYLEPVAPGAYLAGTKTFGNTDYSTSSSVNNDIGKFFCVASSLDTTEDSIVSLTTANLNDSTHPLYLHTYCRSTYHPTANTSSTPWAGTRSFTYKVVFEGLKNNL